MKFTPRNIISGTGVTVAGGEIAVGCGCNIITAVYIMFIVFLEQTTQNDFPKLTSSNYINNATSAAPKKDFVVLFAKKSAHLCAL